MAKKSKVYVNVYLVDRQCGGHEEGGWYYNTYEPIESHGFFSRRKADLKKVELEAQARDDNSDRPPIWSVRSDGVYEVHLEDHIAEYSPKYKPTYE